MVDQTRDGPAEVAAVKAPLPDGFAEAIGHIRTALETCSREGIAQETVLAALMAELMPMLSACYGPRGVSAVLGKVAAAMCDIAEAHEQRH